MTATIMTAGSGGASAPVTAPTATFLYTVAPAATPSTLGIGGVVTVGALIVAAGSVGAAKLLFKKLRNDYHVIEKRNGYVRLKQK